jgi:hypothetical protein
MRRTRRLALTVAGTSLAMALACTPSGGARTTGQAQQGLGDHARLSPQELATYIDDEQYIQKLATPDVRIRLNFADSRQYRFALARFKIAGKTPANSPELFRLLVLRRQEHVAKGYKAGLLPKAEMNLATTSADRQEMHYFESTSLGEKTPAPNDAVATSGSTYPSGAYYTYVDVQITNVSGYPLGSLGWTEQYDEGQNVVANTTGDLSKTQQKRYRVSSYKSEDSPTGFVDSYRFTELGAATANAVATVPSITTPTVTAPQDIRYNDNLISVCLNRTWTQDCDYDLTGNPQSVKVPFAGSVRITSLAHQFDEAFINQLKADLNNNVTRADSGSLKLVLTNAGGGCDVTDPNTLQAKMSQFWNRVTVSIDPTLSQFDPQYNKKIILSWDLTDTNSAFFDDGCRQIQNFAKMTALIPLPMVDSAGLKYSSSITISNDPAVQRPDQVLKQITITNSCLAAGTQVALADGEATAIEKVSAGATVANPYRKSLTVVDTATGVEPTPMVRIRDEAGRTLLMTEMHPILVASRGMVQARALAVGDAVMTRTGPSKLVSVTRERWDGKVYNLKVGSGAEKADLGEDQTVLYANGFVVGDGQIQKKYEERALARKSGSALARLPERWHRDYLLASHR